MTSIAVNSKLSAKPHAAWWTLYLLTLRQHLHGKRWIVMAILFLLPAGLALIVRATAHDVPGINIEFVFAFMLIPQALLPLVALIYAPGIIQDEQEDQTITYLLIRLIPRWGIYLLKLLATFTTTIILTAIFTSFTYIAIYAGADTAGLNIPKRCAIAILVHALAVITYCSLFGLMSLITRRTLIAGVLYVVIVEGLFANLAFGIRLITVIYYARLIAYRILPFFTTFQGYPQSLSADAWQLDVGNDPQLLMHPQIPTCLAVLLGATAAFALIAALLCWRREFHVKTPEKA